jgi:hypothetical protein
MPPVSRFVLPVLLAVSLSACGEADKPDQLAERDSAVTGALADPIMADPDLAGQSRADTALSGGGPAMAEIPPDKRSPEEAERARSAAREMFGGTVAPAPAPSGTVKESKLARAVTMEAVAAALQLGAAHCPAKVGYSFAWAARLPAALPIYPRGHARVAAGTDDAGCKLRAVRFVTPVPPGEVVDFYFAAARKARLSPERRREGGDEVVAGRSGAGAFAVYVRPGPDGLSEVDLVTSGF